MGCRNFLKTASGFAVPVAGMGTGVSRVFAQVPSFPSKETAGNSTRGNPMEYRRLGGLEVAAIGLDCLPMVG